MQIRKTLEGESGKATSWSPFTDAPPPISPHKIHFSESDFPHKNSRFLPHSMAAVEQVLSSSVTHSEFFAPRSRVQLLNYYNYHHNEHDVRFFNPPRDEERPNSHEKLDTEKINPKNKAVWRGRAKLICLTSALQTRNPIVNGGIGFCLKVKC